MKRSEFENLLNRERSTLQEKNAPSGRDARWAARKAARTDPAPQQRGADPVYPPEAPATKPANQFKPPDVFVQQPIQVDIPPPPPREPEPHTVNYIPPGPPEPEFDQPPPRKRNVDPSLFEPSNDNLAQNRPPPSNDFPVQRRPPSNDFPVQNRQPPSNDIPAQQRPSPYREEANNFFTNPVSSREQDRLVKQAEYKEYLQESNSQRRISPVRDSIPKEAPVGNSFFTNPISSQEQARRKQQEEYKQYMQEAAAQPRQRRQEVTTSVNEAPSYVPEQRPLSNARSSIPMVTASQQRKRQYQEDLKQQMQDRNTRKKESRDRKANNTEEYFPFGKSGAGAPYRDNEGNIIAQRPPHFNENDPNFLRASQHYQEIAQQSASPPLQQQGYAPPQQYVQNAPPPQQVYQQPIQQPPVSQYQSSPHLRPPSHYQPPAPPQQYMPNPQMQPPSDFYPPAAPMGYQDQPQQYAQQPPPATPPMNYAYFEQGQTQGAPPAATGSTQVDLQRALSEQIEEKKRKVEEEKRQRILEERMEEARLEKQRRELEEEYQREQDKRKKEIQDLQAFNEQNFMVAAKKQTTRVRTPLEEVEPPKTPPREPPNFNQPPPAPVERKTANDIPIEVTKKLQAGMDNEIWKLRNEINHDQNELRDNIVRLKEEAQMANEQRYEAQKELERIKEEMVQRQAEEDIRSRELYNALILQQKNQIYSTQANKVAEWSVPAVQPSNRETTFKKAQDPYASLTADSQFIPLAHAEGPLKPSDNPKEPTHQDQKAKYGLDAAFPTIPAKESGLVSSSIDPGMLSVASSVGIENINRRNEERLRLLDKVENTPQDELTKLDDLLFNYLNENKAEPEIQRGKAKNAMYAIQESHDDYIGIGAADQGIDLSL